MILSLHLFAAPGDLALARTLRRPWVQWVHAMELPQKPALARSALRRAERSAVLTVSRLAETSPAKSPPSSRLGKQEHV
jgi:hypothetical protein